jgi:hypothetical protein
MQLPLRRTSGDRVDVAGKLQDPSRIRYRRGCRTITDRAGLQRVSGECYRSATELSARSTGACSAAGCRPRSAQCSTWTRIVTMIPTRAICRPNTVRTMRQISARTAAISLRTAAISARICASSARRKSRVTRPVARVVDLVHQRLDHARRIAGGFLPAAGEAGGLHPGSGMIRPERLLYLASHLTDHTAYGAEPACFPPIARAYRRA